jgi:hypothetical protein
MMLAFDPSDSREARKRPWREQTTGHILTPAR